MKKTVISNIGNPALRASLLAIALATGCGASNATEMVYFPLNPSFGGSPLNGPVLMNSAQITNRHTDPDAIDSGSINGPQSALQNFQDSLERNILNRLASAATTKLVDANGNFVPGVLDTGNFTITISNPDASGRITITTLDKSSGGTTIFEVNQQ